MLAFLFLIVTTVAVCSASHQFYVENHCSYPVWAAAFGNNGQTPLGGGWKMNPGDRRQFTVVDHWNGRIWGRTHCTESGQCQTGDCGGLQCNGRTGRPPATLAEFTLDGWGEEDYYDLSLVDGFNLMMTIIPVSGTYDTNHHGTYYCARAGCYSDLNQGCPGEQQQHYGGQVVACKSACEATGRDDYCCRNAHNTPQTCPSFPGARFFKGRCPEAYSYAYDDHKSTFTCRGRPKTAYTVRFC
ncbi:pathogenesis-related protein 5-like [Pecten maximus]|uniref:pathogenesis-related protein 5-like n=1 Tax=Pecten maximus TaxID=6579 RepID=UPI0014580562|nr:pathogenesis-related protein 5-like [Pecten maximus]